MPGESVDDASASQGEGSPAVADEKPSASLWPMFVAFGLATAEVGVVIGIFILTVVGFFAFTGAVTGILTESGYVENSWRALGVMGALVVVGGVAVFWWYGGTVGGTPIITVSNAIAYRGLSLIAAGAITLLTAGVGSVRTSR
jgi:hypothetical protein